ncbi:Beta-amylase 5 [Porphyridium purpureum]|uniref:Beta-amylase n=1 Tax=Porphyridium purpureum TaxID=35688 RepID=A0A5J4YHV1_PORPP|nr:Beta-amylase 5 [Porphyridium purpureum]|eukprot:POR7822..scf251_18
MQDQAVFVGAAGVATVAVFWILKRLTAGSKRAPSKSAPAVTKLARMRAPQDGASSVVVPAKLKPVGVYVMMPLDVRECELGTLKAWLVKLKDAGVRGVMMDFWWSAVESKPEVYDWTCYDPIVELCEHLGLKMQAVMSFHVCGECDGDGAFVPLPDWIQRLSEEDPDILFLDEKGNKSAECLSFGVDHERIFPGKRGPKTRTAIDMYKGFMKSFCHHYKAYLSSTIVEVQVGMGPSGELRYPSYSLSKWTFPGIGMFQCFDKRLRADCRWKTWADVPAKAVGSYNDIPEDTSMFLIGTTAISEKAKRFFLTWYFERMYQHGSDVLRAANDVFDSSTGVVLSGKVAGIHWFRKHPSRAAEAVAGYYCTKEFNAYEKIAELFKKNKTVFLFTCLEKADQNESPHALASPEALVRETSAFCAKHRVLYGGENALEFKDAVSYQMILDQVNACQTRGVDFVSFTLLRLDETLVSGKHYDLFCSFVAELGRDLSRNDVRKHALRVKYFRDMTSFSVTEERKRIIVKTGHNPAYTIRVGRSSRASGRRTQALRC